MDGLRGQIFRKKVKDVRRRFLIYFWSVGQFFCVTHNFYLVDYPSAGEFNLESCFVCVGINSVRFRPESGFEGVPFLIRGFY